MNNHDMMACRRPLPRGCFIRVKARRTRKVRRGLKVSRCGEAARGFSVVDGRVRRGLEVSRCGARQGLRSGRRQGSSWIESEHILRAHVGSSIGERACAVAREKSALPILMFARFV